MNSSLRHHWVAILATTLTTFVASVVLTVTQPMEYRSAFTVLAIDNNSNLDGYAAAKSAERLSQSLARTLATTAFADQVYQQLKDRSDLVGNDIVSADVQRRRDAWKKEISALAIPDVGQVKVNVYSRERSQVDTIANTIAITITAYGNTYLGGGESVMLKIVDTPLASQSPVRPNVFANLAVGLILGFAGSMAYFLLFGAPVQAQQTRMVMAPAAPAMLPQAALQRLTANWVKPSPKKSEPVNQPESEMELHIPEVPATKPARPVTQKAASPANLPVIDEIVMP